MKTAIASLAAQVAALTAFEARYQPGERQCLVHHMTPEGSPHVVFWDRAWVVATLGSEGWMTDMLVTEGHQSISKTVDGVKVTIHKAYPVEGLPFKPTLVPTWRLTGAEAGIDLAPEAVLEVLA